MARRRARESTVASNDVDTTLAALDADALRDLIRELLCGADERLHDWLLDRLVARAARSGAAWMPEGPTSEAIAAMVDFASAAERIGYAESREVDEYLREGIRAFLSRDYATAHAVFRALLVPVGDGEIYLGQDELVDEVLTVDLAACAAMHTVAAYMSAAPCARAEAVRSAIEDTMAFGHFLAPVREMERAAVEPLPDLDDFLAGWRHLLEANRDQRADDWIQDEDRWLREVIERMEGAAGLENLARETGRLGDLQAWCRALASAEDWRGALVACEDAAAIVAGDTHAVAQFLDGGALVARNLGRRDLPARLERAWRADPTLVRLLRWLGTAKSRAAVRKMAQHALEACPKRSARQTAFLHVLLGNADKAAQLLARAAGLGWSGAEHPGHLLFPLFQRLLGDAGSRVTRTLSAYGGGECDDDALEWLVDDHENPPHDAPDIEDVVALAGADRALTDEARSALLGAMRKAAENRVAGVTGKQRRNYYGHAASLVAACAGLDASPQMTKWVTRVRERFRRYPAFQRELASHLAE
ncbi:MAG: hypothetical protein ACYTGZ_22795 [Planctomycetota bacterium]|jgi:hypothetical protein